MTSKFLIYGLVDPRDGQLRYVGKSTSGLERPKAHGHPSVLRKSQGYKANWLRLLKSMDLSHSIVIIQEFEDSEILPVAEIYWISYFKGMGCRLTNMTDGGEGVSGLKRSKNTKSKMSLSRGGPPREDVERIVALYSSGASTRAIGKSVGRSSGVVFKVLKREGVKIRNKSEAHPRPMSEGQIKKAVEEYSAGMSAPALATKYDVGSTSVYRWLELRGIERRGRW